MKKLHIEFQNENQWPKPESERLVTLCDGRRGLRGCLAVRVSEPPAAERSSRSSCVVDSLSSSRGGEGRGEEANSSKLVGSQVQCAESSGPRAPSQLPILDFVASDETLDRYSEIIRASGWRLDHYLRNPVFQNSHQYGDVIFTLGKALETRVVEGSLRQRIQFATDINPMARIAYGLYKGGFLNAVSVGFIPIHWEDSPATPRACSQEVSCDPPLQMVGTRSTASVTSSEKVGHGGTRPYLRQTESQGKAAPSAPRRIYLEQELLEVSAVSIPANPNALVMGIRSGAVVESEVKELLEILNSTISDFRSNHKAIRNADTCALGVPDDEARSWLLRAVKGLAEAMKPGRHQPRKHSG